MMNDTEKPKVVFLSYNGLNRPAMVMGVPLMLFFVCGISCRVWWFWMHVYVGNFWTHIPCIMFLVSVHCSHHL
ncbi:hypothetical protein CRG93_24660 [Escherichia sp. E2593]|uniref:VirB3 family type IV secretion system protein n=1 Tax=Escherichia sp. E2593 TaxID=2044458 RepID=UPI00107FB94D|nr:hypothetical protein CRG93_24660 [Escherichia sp. E2593]